MILKPHHKRAARYFLVGMTPQEVVERLRFFKLKDIKNWRNDLIFKKYMVRLENRYLKALDADINQLRRTAISRLQSIIELEDTDSTHFEWAINKVFAITLKREETINLNNRVELMEPRSVETPEQKRALKDLIRLTGNADRYTQNKQSDSIN